MSVRPLCLVLMPFGKPTDASGATIDFDAVYRNVIAPAIEDAGMEGLRSDSRDESGLFTTSRFEPLILCDFAVVDLTMANAGIYYALGVRHAVRPRNTVLTMAEGVTPAMDLQTLQPVQYRLNQAGRPEAAENARRELVNRILESGTRAADNPVFALVETARNREVDHRKTDVFRERAEYSTKIKQQLKEARIEGVDAVRAVEAQLGSIGDAEAGVVVDLFLSYRAVAAWDQMIALAGKMPAPLAETVMVQEQLAMALNRTGQSDAAERVLQVLLDRHGPSSETYGLLGRIYKDRWESAAKKGDAIAAQAALDQAIGAYLRGFETDWRDAYPGINAITLMELRNPPDPRRERLLPVVRYAVERRIATGKPDYWDYATQLEIAILNQDENDARKALGQAISSVREKWEPATTLRNLRLIRQGLDRRGAAAPWMLEVERTLEQAPG